MAAAEEGAPYALRISETEVQRYQLMAARAVEREALLLQRAGVVAGARVVDIGCGPAAMLVQLAKLVGPDGEVVGVEPDPASRAIAGGVIASAELGWARVIEGRGDATGLPKSAWDVAMIRHVLFHVGEHAADIVAHAAQLVRPGGHVYVVDTMMDALRIEPGGSEAREQTQRYADFQRARGNDPNIGIRLHVLIAQAGLELSQHEGYFNIIPGRLLSSGGPLGAAQTAMLAAGAITEAEAQRFAETRARLAADPLVRLLTPQFVAVGRRPD